MAAGNNVKSRNVFLLVALTAAVVITAFVTGDRYFRISKAMESFAEVYRAVDEAYVDETNPSAIAQKGMDEMLNTLDPYTNYYSEDNIEDARTGNLSGYGGIGAESHRFGKRTIVTRVFEGSPAARAGIRPGDEIIKLDGVDVSSLTHEQAGKRVRGQTGTSVNVEFLSAGKGSPVKADIRREHIDVKTVTYYGMSPDFPSSNSSHIGYMVLEQFGERSASEVAEALKDLRKKGATALIVDLRGNPGGLLDQAVRICGLFIEKGKLVVSTRSRDGQNNMQYLTPDAPAEPALPVVVLINRSSASASEIVAGTLQDYDRGVVIGERSFGKGLVQTRRPLSYNSVSMITTARYYTPSGRCIQVLDYSRRRPDGSVGSVPESAKRAFTTVNGRVVYDGGGIDPDIRVDRDFNGDLDGMLRKNGYIVEFAARYRTTHPSIPEPVLFQPEPSTIAAFKDWLKTQNLQYPNPVDDAFHSVKKLATEENLIEPLSPSLDELSQELKKAHLRLLDKHERQLKKVLTEEIVRGYYLDNGAAAAGFPFDPEWQEAVNLLQNQKKYESILSGKN